MDQREVKNYLTPFEPEMRPVFWFDETFPANSWSRLHSHGWGELAYVPRGCMVVCTQAGNWLAPPDRAVWIPAGMTHEWYVPCQTRDCSLWIDQRVFMPLERFKCCHVMELSPLLREILLHLAPRACQYGSDPMGRLVLAMLDQIIEQPEVPEPLAMPRDRRLIEMCTSLLAAPGQDVSLAEWAARLGMSERNLGRIFHKETGTSFRDWRHAQRMHNAHGRLRQGESVTSVAIDAGYSSLSAFIAAFRKKFGFTPGQIRSSAA